MDIKPNGEFIKLCQVLKAANLIEKGSDAKEIIFRGEVLVNGEKETRRGKKLYPGDEVLYQGEKIRIIS